MVKLFDENNKKIMEQSLVEYVDFGYRFKVYAIQIFFKLFCLINQSCRHLASVSS